METTELIRKIDVAVPGAVLETRPFGRSGAPSIWVEMRSIQNIADFVKNDPAFQFDWLENVSAMEFEKALVLTYFLRSTTISHSLLLRGSIMPESPEALVDVMSVAGIWPMAKLQEQELGDLFGIRFLGNYDKAKRPMLRADWRGYPLRKGYEFPVEVMGMPHLRPARNTLSNDGITHD